MVLAKTLGLLVAYSGATLPTVLGNMYAAATTAPPPMARLRGVSAGMIELVGVVERGVGCIED
jgi:hypothetical protein